MGSGSEILDPENTVPIPYKGTGVKKSATPQHHTIRNLL
jgi:hypothetical protein